MFLSLFLCALIIIALLLYKLSTIHHEHWKRKGVPFLKPVPIFGNFTKAFLGRDTMANSVTNLYKQMKEHDFFGVWVLHDAQLVVNSPELIKHVLIKDFNVFCDRPAACNKKADPIISNAMFMSNNPEWKILRSKVTPFFTTGRLKHTIKLINSVGDDLIEFVKKNPVYEAKDLGARYVVDVIATCAFGINAYAIKHKDSLFLKKSRDMFANTFSNLIRGVSYFFLPKVVDVFLFSFFTSDINDYFRNVFMDVVKEREKTGIKRSDYLDVLIESKNATDLPFDDDIIMGQVIQFLAAGFETSSTTICFTLFELAVHQDVQTRLREELSQIFDPKESNFTVEAISKTRYLDQVLKETLRKYPALPFLNRTAMQDYEIPNTNIVIEKGTNIIISMQGLQNDPRYFPNPELFDPDRFSKENIGSIVPYTYMPFGEGPRICVGERFAWLTVKLAIARIILNFEVTLGKGTSKTITFKNMPFLIESEHPLNLNYTPL